MIRLTAAEILETVELRNGDGIVVANVFRPNDSAANEWMPLNDENCGTGAGGFQQDNTCAVEDGSSTAAKAGGAGAADAGGASGGAAIAAQPPGVAVKPKEKTQIIGPDKVRVGEVDYRYDKPAQALARKVFGRDVTPDDLGRMIGMHRPGADVEVTADKNDQLMVVVKHPEFRARRRFFRDKAGELVCQNTYIRATKPGGGLGTEIFNDQIKALADAGVSKIIARAERGTDPDTGKEYNGYYTWPRLGYDGPIPSDYYSSFGGLFGGMPAKFQKAKTFSELFEMEGGPEWWQAKGKTVELEFEVKEGSKSRKRLDMYVAAKASRKRPAGNSAWDVLANEGDPANDDWRNAPVPESGEEIELTPEDEEILREVWQTPLEDDEAPEPSRGKVAKGTTGTHQKVWWNGRSRFMVRTAIRKGQNWGRLVDLAAGTVGPEESFSAIVGSLPEDDFEGSYHGESLERVRALVNEEESLSSDAGWEPLEDREQPGGAPIGGESGDAPEPGDLEYPDGEPLEVPDDVDADMLDEVFNVFCPTGEGGGVDPTCSLGASAGSRQSLLPMFSKDEDNHLHLREAYRKARPLLDDLVAKAVAEKREVTILRSWDDVPEAEQDEARSEWIEEHHQEYESDDWEESVSEQISSDLYQSDEVAKEVWEEWAGKQEGFKDEWLEDFKQARGGTIHYDRKNEDLDEWMTAERQADLQADYDERVSHLLMNEMENQEPPDSVREDAIDAARDAWVRFSDEEKFEHAGISKIARVEEPKAWKVVADGADYDRTRAVALALQEDLVQHELTARGLTGRRGGAAPPGGKIFTEDLAGELWAGWKSSSTSREGLLLQHVAAKELGGAIQKFTPLQEQQIDLKAESLGRDYVGSVRGDASAEELRKIGMDLVGAHVRGTWLAAQHVMDKAGIESLPLYRAVWVDGSTIPDADMKVSRETVKVAGDKVKVKGEKGLDVQVTVGPGREFVRINGVQLRKNGAASTAAGDKGLAVANSWDGVGEKPKNPVRLVVRIDAPRESYLSVPVFGQNIAEEQEVVVTGAHWYDHDVFLNEAPSIERLPVGKGKS